MKKTDPKERYCWSSSPGCLVAADKTVGYPQCLPGSWYEMLFKQKPYGELLKTPIDPNHVMKLMRHMEEYQS
jgi:hypothetical protein